LQRIRAFEHAHDCYLFRGAGNPDHIPAIEARFEAARERLIGHLMNGDALL
jgi:hypothetical protein